MQTRAGHWLFRWRMLAGIIALVLFSAIGAAVWGWYVSRPEFVRDRALRALEASDGLTLCRLASGDEVSAAHLDAEKVTEFLRVSGWSGQACRRRTLERIPQPVDVAAWAVAYHDCPGTGGIVLPLLNYPDGRWRLNITYLLMMTAAYSASRDESRKASERYSELAQGIGIHPVIFVLQDAPSAAP
jgi:hypothetical protein